MKALEISLGGRLVGPAHEPFIIAEMSGNHNQSIERAFAIIDAAAEAGAHAIKIQTYTADTITLNAESAEFQIKDEKSLWKNKSLHGLYKEAFTPWEWHADIFKHAKKKGLICFSTPFDESAVDLLEKLNAPFYKIASFENVHLPLIERVAKTGKPVIISTGMATAAEIDDAVRTVRNAGNEQIILLKCTSTYPAEPSNTNIRTIPHLASLFHCIVGLSDHTAGTGVAVGAVALGASLVEKHFTLRRADGGVDSAFSLEPEELKALVVETKRAWQALGEISYGPTEAEKKSLQFRRSIYIAADMKAGETFTEKNLRAVRPGLGLPPKFLPELLGKKIKKDAKLGTPMSWDLIG